MGITRNIDIKEKDLKNLLSLLDKYLPNTSVWAFGSRVKFTSRPQSDLDLVAFIRPEQQNIINDLKDAFAESDLPFRVDILDWNAIPDNFKRNIEKEYMIVQDANAKKARIPGNWKTYRLEDAVEKLIDYRGKTPIKTEYGIPLITAKVIKNGIINTPDEFIAEDEYECWMTRGIPEYGDVVLTTEAPLGEIAQIDTRKKIALAQRVITLRGKKNIIDNTYLKYFLMSPIGQGNLKAKETGTTVTGIKQSELREVEIFAPDYNTQQSIASILSSLDDKIEINRQMNQTLEAIAQAIFKEWFVNFNFPGYDGQLVDGLPKGWKRGKLGESFNLIMGQSPPGESYNESGEGEVFYQGRTDFGFRFPSNRMYTTAPSRRAKQFDTLVSVRAPVGDINMAIENCCIGRGLSSVRHKSGAYSFTYYSMKYLQNVFRGFESEGPVFGSINKANFENIDVVVPASESIQEFEQVVNSIDDKILNNTIEIQIFTTFRDALLPKLITGKIEVKA